MDLYKNWVYRLFIVYGIDRVLLILSYIYADATIKMRSKNTEERFTV